jgi:hypothetical protein
MDIEGDTAQAVNDKALPQGGTPENAGENGPDEAFARRMGWRPEIGMVRPR